MLLPLIKYDLLTKDKLVQLASQQELIQGMEKIVIDALCSKLQGN